MSNASVTTASRLAQAMAGPEDSRRLRRLLVVDDDPALRRVLAETMGRFGYEVTVAGDAADAMGRLRSRPDVVAVSSCLGGFPVMTAVDFGVHLRRAVGLPVLFLMSGPAPVGLLDDPLLGVINKPMAMSDLRDRLDELLERATAATRSSGGPDIRRAVPGRVHPCLQTVGHAPVEFPHGVRSPWATPAR